jgi:hypothetical protein
MSEPTGHPTIGGLRVDAIFSECFQQSDTVLDDGRYVYETTAYAEDNHEQCMDVAQIVLDYKTNEYIDFQQWQAASFPILAALFVAYIGFRLGLFR